MNTKFIFLLLIIFSSCATPQKVKDASHAQNESMKLFVQENTKFYTIIEAALDTLINKEINDLELKKVTSINNAKKGTDQINEKIKNDPLLSTEAKIDAIMKNERNLYEDILLFNNVAERQIQTHKDRMNKVHNAVFILINMQTALANSNMKLDEYIQLKKASEYLLEEVKSTFPQLSDNVLQFQSIINSINFNQ